MCGRCVTRFICVTWLIFLRDMTHLYVWHDSSVCVSWLIHACDMTNSYVWHDSSVCVSWIIQMCHMPHSDVWRDSYLTHLHVWHVSFRCLPWCVYKTLIHIHTCDKTQSYVWRWCLAKTWMSHVTHMNESCHTKKWVLSQIWIWWVTHLLAVSPARYAGKRTPSTTNVTSANSTSVKNLCDMKYIYYAYMCMHFMYIWVCVIAIITHGEEKHTPSTHAYANYTPVKNLNNITFICYIYMCMFLMYVRVCVIAIIYTWERGAHSTDTRIRQLCLRQESVWCNAYILCIYVYLHYVWMSICDCGYTYMRKSSTLHRHTHLPTLPPSRICMI